MDHPLSTAQTSVWNTFFKDASEIIKRAGFTKSIYADDLNAGKSFAATTEDKAPFFEEKACQTELHNWGKANRVCFDPLKESFHVLARTDGTGGN